MSYEMLIDLAYNVIDAGGRPESAYELGEILRSQDDADQEYGVALADDITPEEIDICFGIYQLAIEEMNR